MSRPLEPEIKKKLLQKCFKAVLKKGSLDMSINELGADIGSSGRMLVYHFGSKKNLDRLISGCLESALRDAFKRFAETQSQNDSFLIDFWEHATSDRKLVMLLRLAHELAYYSVKEKALQSKMEEETVSWILLLKKHFRSEETATVVLLLFQGALLDFFMTGDSSRGRRALAKIMEGLKLEP